MSELHATQMEAHATSSVKFDTKENLVQSAPPYIDETLIAAEALSIRRGHKTGVSRVLRGEMNVSSSTPQFPSHHIPRSSTQENEQLRSELQDIRSKLQDTRRQLDELRVLVLRTIPAARPSSSSNQLDQDDGDEHLDDD
ncbi:hypothetical protein PanWU01x14_042740 [Parasponia andersonii]|uniref:Uncharacterized protein n=1 Tax=Parasponia andersonii TaxID=3476 RepID=A0A2P5DPU3_PARAD|nr:hypothetical protein PanWU01x14_042740 [Parasponia andersonii]